MKTFLLFLSLTLPVFGAPVEMQKFATHYALESLGVPPAVRKEVTGKPWQSEERRPVDGLKLFAKEMSGALWLGSEQGAARFDPNATHRWDRWQYFFGPRWLRDNEIRNIWIDETGPSRKIWLRTRSGVSLIEWRPMALEEKAGFFDKRIEQRHVRHGMVSDCTLREAGDLSTSETRDNDIDGLWTAMYLGAQVYRYAATHDPDAQKKAQRSLRLLMRLEEITGLSGFPARSFLSKDEPRTLPPDGEWHSTPDGQWLWKGDTSSDHLVGHYYAYALYYDLVADETEKEAIRKVVSRLTDHLIKNNYNLIDLDGKPTRWGEFGKVSVNQSPSATFRMTMPAMTQVSLPVSENARMCLSPVRCYG